MQFKGGPLPENGAEPGPPLTEPLIPSELWLIKKKKKTLCLSSPEGENTPSSWISLDKCWGVCRLYPHSWGDRWWRTGHWEDWEELFKQSQPSKIKQGESGREEGPQPSAGEGPHRSYVAESHKQTATAAPVPPASRRHQRFYSPLRTPAR